jgi:hypothetical protein
MRRATSVNISISQVWPPSFYVSAFQIVLWRPTGLYTPAAPSSVLAVISLELTDVGSYTFGQTRRILKAQFASNGGPSIS